MIIILQVSNFKHVYKNNAYQQIIEDVNIPNSYSVQYTGTCNKLK